MLFRNQTTSLHLTGHLLNSRRQRDVYHISTGSPTNERGQVLWGNTHGSVFVDVRYGNP
jgi:hypothetical protein